MTIEERLRRVLHAEADTVDVDADAWNSVQHEVARRRRPWAHAKVGVAVLAAAAMVAVAVGVVAMLGPDDGQRVDVGPPAATDPTTAPPTSAPPAGEDEELFPGIWPFASQDEVDAYEEDPGTGMFYDPEATALEFARVYLGMREPDSEGMHFETPTGGDGGLVATMASKRGSPLTTSIGVTQFGGSDGPYSVTFARTDNIHVTRPASGDTIGREVSLGGKSTAFEGTVQVEVRQDAQTFGERLGSGFVTGGSMGDLEPFAGSITFDEPTAPAGAVVFYTESAEDGSLQEATVVRVAFGRETTEFSVFFHRGENLVEVPRETGTTVAVLRTALGELFKGPQPDDGEGLSSLFSADTAHLLGDVALRSDGTAVVDLAGTVPNANTSAGSQEFLAELNATVFQFETVDRIEYRLDGSCDAFWEWLQYGECRLVDRT